MSVPAFKNSRSKVRRRRSHHALKAVQLVHDKVTGELKRPHHVIETAKKLVKKTVKVSSKKAKAVKPTKEAKVEKK